MSGEEADDAVPAPVATGHLSGMVVVSLALVGISVVGLARPPGLGPVAPFLAGVCAFLGYGTIRRHPGQVRGAGLARVAMTASLVLLVLQGWLMWRGAPAAQAFGAMRSRTAAVESVLRDGTAEAAWDLLAEETHAALDRETWLAEMRASMATLGGLRTLGEPRRTGREWDQSKLFLEGDEFSMFLPLDFDATFANGPGDVHLEFHVSRRERVVRVRLVQIVVTDAR